MNSPLLLPKKILIIVENLPVPPDRRVWLEATTLSQAGYEVSVICPKGHGYDKSFENIDGVHIFRHPFPYEANNALGYAFEYSWALFWQFVLSLRVLFVRGFDAIHACNPPDTIFLIAAFYKLFGKKYIFDHHDLNPELYTVKFGRKDFFYKLLLLLERLTFMVADVSIATNESYKKIAVERNGMKPDDVFIVRSAPQLVPLSDLPPLNPAYRNNRRFLVGYVGVMAKEDGIDGLLRSIQQIVQVSGRSDIQFVLIGRGTELESLRIYAAKLGISDFVTFTGWLQGQELLAALNSIDVGVVPDKVNEINDKSTTNKVMSYMSVAKPMVQYSTTEGRFSAQEAAAYASANDEVDFARLIIRLIDNEAERERMGRLGRKRMEEVLDWRYEIPKLLAAFDRLFGQA